LVICQIINTVVLVVFANATSSSVIYLTCDTLPLVPVMLFEYITDIESMISTSVLFFLRVSRMSSMQLSQSIIIFSHFTHSLFALSLI